MRIQVNAGNLQLYEKRLQERCFPANLANIFKIPFLHNTSERLLMNSCIRLTKVISMNY